MGKRSNQELVRSEQDSLAPIQHHAHLAAPGQPYDYLQSLPLIEKIAVAWEGYEVSATRFDAAVRSQLD